MASARYSLALFALLAWQLYPTEAKLTNHSQGARGKFRHTTNDVVEPHSLHVVYMGGVHPAKATNNEAFHKGMLQQVLGSADAASESILYSYTKSFNGFAAVFSDAHAVQLRGMQGVVSVFKSKTMQLHTTNSWEYLGLNPTEGVWPLTGFGDGTIIGMIDTGITPESKSFNDHGFGPIPSRWKGSCVPGPNFTHSICNKKLIGAKFYVKGYEAAGGVVPKGQLSPRDFEGHGTHTASTSAGGPVANASLSGVAGGTACGGAPAARVAMYKVCWDSGCSTVDILAGMEDAIADGVDIMSISLGGSSARNYSDDPIAIGAFHAMEKGVFVACSAGNSGDSGYGTAVNVAPWILTVAASTQNRVLLPTVFLIDPSSEDVVVVEGINTVNALATNNSYPIIYVAKPFNVSSNETAGKIVAIDASYAYSYDGLFAQFGAVGVVASTGADPSVGFASEIPLANVAEQYGLTIETFINDTENPHAFITKSASVYNSTQSPVMAWFSSLGPNVISPLVMKPDISAPGVDILAAWAPVASPTDFNIISGTSMSCPHAAATAALVKSVHPDWSPAAIKSAIMTTATPFLPLNRSSSYGNDSIAGNSPIASGAGQINPTKAVDPGLIFNISTTDYINFLCASGYNSSTVDLMTGGTGTCPTSDLTNFIDLNYPSVYTDSFTVGVCQSFTRKLTNVGFGPAYYELVNGSSPRDIDVDVNPSYLNFTEYNQELSFTVSLKVTKELTDYVFGYLKWSDYGGWSGADEHVVTITIGGGPYTVPYVDYY